jgi:hypothetical protein
MSPFRAFIATFALGLIALSAGRDILLSEPAPDVQVGPISADAVAA